MGHRARPAGLLRQGRLGPIERLHCPLNTSALGPKVALAPSPARAMVSILVAAAQAAARK